MGGLMGDLLNAEVKQGVEHIYARCASVPTTSALAEALYLKGSEGTDPETGALYCKAGFVSHLEYSPEHPYWIRHAGHAVGIWGRSRGVDSRMVALSWLEGSYPVITPANSPIRSVADLKGKRLGIVRSRDAGIDRLYAQQLKTYATTLGTAGLDLSDIRLVPIDRERFDPHSLDSHDGRRDRLVQDGWHLLARLTRGDFDAVAGRFPDAIAEAVGLKVLYDTRSHPDPLARVNPSVLRGVVVSGPLLRDRRDLVVHALIRLLKAAAWAEENPWQIAEKLSDAHAITEEQFPAAYENLSEGVQLDLDPAKIAALRVQKDFFLEHGLIDRDFSVDSWIDPAPLREARRLYAKARTDRPERWFPPEGRR